MNIAEIYESHYLPEKSKKRRPSTVAGYDSSVRLHVLRGGFVRDRGHRSRRPAGVGGRVRSCRAAEKAYKCLRQIVRWWIRQSACISPIRPLRRAAGEGAVPSDVLDAEGVTAMLRACGAMPWRPLPSAP